MNKKLTAAAQEQSRPIAKPADGLSNYLGEQSQTLVIKTPPPPPPPRNEPLLNGYEARQARKARKLLEEQEKKDREEQKKRDEAMIREAGSLYGPRWS